MPIPSGGGRTPNGTEFKLVVEELGFECVMPGFEGELLFLFGIPPTDTPGPKLCPPQGPRIGGSLWVGFRIGVMTCCC